jgi:hypothetical protein
MGQIERWSESMSMNNSGVRVLVALALGLAALAGLDAVLRALLLPDWLPRLAVLVGFLMVIAVTIAVGLTRKPSNETLRE